MMLAILKARGDSFLPLIQGSEGSETGRSQSERSAEVTWYPGRCVHQRSLCIAGTQSAQL